MELYSGGFSFLLLLVVVDGIFWMKGYHKSTPRRSVPSFNAFLFIAFLLLQISFFNFFLVALHPDCATVDIL